MNNANQWLEKELLQAGATKREASDLAALARQLKRLKPTPDRRARAWRAKAWKPAISAFGGLAIGVAVVVIAQSVTPASWLFPVQKFTDNAAIRMHPEYRGTVMMRRAQQVNQLVASRADSEVVLSTLKDYTRQASAYETSNHASYAAFEYCKTNLQQAAARAPANIRTAINASLSSLQTI